MSIKKILGLFALVPAMLLVAACGMNKVEKGTTMAESTVFGVDCEEEGSNQYRCEVKTKGVGNNSLAIFESVYIDGNAEKITRVNVVRTNESADYGNALIYGKIKTADGKTFYNKYVNIGEEGLSFSELDKLQYTKTDEIKSVVVVDENGNAKSSKVKIYQPDDLATGATGTACAQINALKAAIETYRNLKK